MKASEIKVGGFYHDGKLGVREVISIEPFDATYRVTYKILAAKVMQEYSYAEQKVVSVVGNTTSCTLISFAAWAKKSMTAEECADLLKIMEARRIKLSPGELAVMNSLLNEVGSEDIRTGCMFSINPTENRAVAGLEKKGLVMRDSEEMEITQLGEAWFKSARTA